MGQATSIPSSTAQAQVTPPSGCPMHAQQAAASSSTFASAPAQCPVAHSSSASTSSASSISRPEQCPIDHISSSSSGTLNPLNHMPNLSNAPAPDQASILPTERTSSNIPRGGAQGGVWEYPSPQQFHHALLRKGKGAPEENVEMMVQIHNWLNEAAWDEVAKWEKREDSTANIELARFCGRPSELSPKARFWLFAGWLLPTRFNSEPPFDRHDWIVRRPKTGEEVRYVIDYYSAPDDEHGMPMFSLDVRPALDSVQSIRQRISVATEEAWAGWKESQKQSSR